MSQTHKVLSQVDEVIGKAIKKNSRDLNAALIKPLTDDYPFSSNDVYFFCSKMGGGKTYSHY